MYYSILFFYSILNPWQVQFYFTVITEYYNICEYTWRSILIFFILIFWLIDIGKITVIKKDNTLGATYPLEDDEECVIGRYKIC